MLHASVSVETKLFGEKVYFLLASSFNFNCGEMGDLGNASHLIIGPETTAELLLVFFSLGPTSLGVVDLVPSLHGLTTTLLIETLKLDPIFVGLPSRLSKVLFCPTKAHFPEFPIVSPFRSRFSAT